MTAWIPALQATALCLSLMWLLLALAARPRSVLSVTWAVFCASLAMMLARSLVGPGGGLAYTLLGLGACLTCNGFWLVSRALFREGRPFGTPHLAYAGAVAALIITTQQAAWLPPPVAAAARELLGLLSSGALLMAFWEGLRGWRRHADAERAMRTVYLLTYGGCVGATLVVPVLAGPAGEGPLHAATAALAAATILLVTQGLVAWRLRHPLGAPLPAAEEDAEDAAMPLPMAGDAPCVCAEPDAAGALAPQPPSADEAALRAEDAALARRLEQYMRAQRPYLQAELKLGHLAQALDVSEYRISRAVRGPLRQRNVNQYVNAYRLEHARGLLGDPSRQGWSTLVVGLESGFGSLGAFHRAFRAAEGCTPGEYRAAHAAPGNPSPG